MPARRASPMKIVPGADQAFLVGERNARARPDGGECRREAGRPDDPGHDDVDRTRGAPVDGGRAGGGLDPRAGSASRSAFRPLRSAITAIFALAIARDAGKLSALPKRRPPASTS